MCEQILKKRQRPNTIQILWLAKRRAPKKAVERPTVLFKNITDIDHDPPSMRKISCPDFSAFTRLLDSPYQVFVVQQTFVFSYVQQTFLCSQNICAFLFELSYVHVQNFMSSQSGKLQKRLTYFLEITILNSILCIASESITG